MDMHKHLHTLVRIMYELKIMLGGVGMRLVFKVLELMWHCPQ